MVDNLCDLFKQDLTNALAMYDFNIHDIEYINLDNTYSISPEVFFDLTEFPSVVASRYLHVGWCKKWDIPYDFRVMMKNGTVFLYNMNDDEYYNAWKCVPPCVRSPVAIIK